MSQLTPQPQYEPPYGPDPFPISRPKPPPESALRVLLKRAFTPVAILVGLALKFKTAALVVLKVPILATSGTMLVSFAAYWWLWGWRFGLGFVLMILVHELGHVVELRRQGIPASAPMFIPFLGAYVTLKERPLDAWSEAKVAYAGPLLGSIAPLGCWIAGEVLDSDLLVALAFVGFFINLFNLAPMLPLDGGRIVGALHPTIWAIGLAGLLVLAFLRPNPVLLIILALGSFELWSRWRHKDTEEGAAYYQVSARQRVVVAVAYLGLAALLALGMSATHLERSF